MINKNERMLKRFTAYCEAHPEERFFQALRNFAQLHIDSDINFVFFGAGNIMDYDGMNLLRDTFYMEDDKFGPTRSGDTD